jgi:hypothetical protein
MTTPKKYGTGLWPDAATALLFLRNLLPGRASLAPLPPLPRDAVAAYCVEQGLGPWVADTYGNAWPELSQKLALDAISSRMEGDLYRALLRRTATVLHAAGLPMVLLKGAALVETVYAEPTWRTMSDVDVWLQATDMPRALVQLPQAGFEHQRKAQGPPRLSARGKIKFNEPGWTIGGVELHVNPFAGVLMEATAAVNLHEIWGRIRPITLDNIPAYRMSAEDMLIHVAAHLAISNQFCQAAIRGLLDIACIAYAETVDWAAVADRARRWRLATAVWLTLKIGNALFPLDGSDQAVAALAPSAARQALLSRFVNVPSVVAGSDFRGQRRRYLFLYLMVDQPLSALRYVRRALT